MYNTPDYIKAYYFVDRFSSTPIIKFPTKQELLNYIVKRSSNFWMRNSFQLSDLITDQNLTGNDLQIYYDFTQQTNQMRLKRFTCYVTYDNIYLTVINFETLMEDIHNTKYPKHIYNKYKKRYHQAYQYKSKTFNAKKYKINPEDLELLNPTSRRKKGLYKNESYSYYGHSDKSWKTQTKNKHQYGNVSRNKYIEAEYVNSEYYHAA